MLLGPARKALSELGEELGREIEVRARPGLHQDQFEVTALDEGPPVTIPLRWLEERKPDKDENDEEELLATPAAEAAAATVESETEVAPESEAASPVEAESDSATAAESIESAEPESAATEAAEDDAVDDTAVAIEVEVVPETADPTVASKTAPDSPSEEVEAANAAVGPAEATEPVVPADVPDEPKPAIRRRARIEKPRESAEMVDSERESPILPRLEDPKES
jgi:hypothetical protein